MQVKICFRVEEGKLYRRKQWEVPGGGEKVVLRTTSSKQQLKRNLKVPENYGHRKVGKIDRIEETKRKCKTDIHASIR